jgi:hypothetical protein
MVRWPLNVLWFCTVHNTHAHLASRQRGPSTHTHPSPFVSFWFAPFPPPPHPPPPTPRFPYPGNWLYFNDTVVVPIPDEEIEARVETPEAYVVLYRLNGSDAPAHLELTQSLDAVQELSLEELPAAQLALDDGVRHRRTAVKEGRD